MQRQLTLLVAVCAMAAACASQTVAPDGEVKSRTFGLARTSVTTTADGGAEYAAESDGLTEQALGAFSGFFTLLRDAANAAARVFGGSEPADVNVTVEAPTAPTAAEPAEPTTEDTPE